jgi:hypothetical protein
MRRASHSGWGRVFACLLIYALVLQGFILAVLLDGPAVAAADGQAWAGFKLCSHSGVGSAGPDAPAQAPAGGIHCIFCIAGATFVGSAPPLAPQCGRVAFTNAVWPLAAPGLVAPLIHESAWPRGPPAAV